MQNIVHNNLYTLRPYVSKDLCCDRKQEMLYIIRFLENGSPIHKYFKSPFYSIADFIFGTKAGADQFTV